MQSLSAVTVESLRQLMEAYPFEPMTIVSLGPEAGAPAKASPGS
jgi:predicted Zn-dependent peptidase